MVVTTKNLVESSDCLIIVSFQFVKVQFLTEKIFRLMCELFFCHVWFATTKYNEQKVLPNFFQHNIHAKKNVCKKMEFLSEIQKIISSNINAVGTKRAQPYS